MLDLDQLRLQATGIRANELLGRSGHLLRLFDYFVECAEAGRVPKEIEVAVEVFGKSADFNVVADAAVRVYIHKLRRRLDEYYAGQGRHEPLRLTLPKGEYRLDLVPNAAATPETRTVHEASRPVRRRWLPWALAGLAALLVANLALPVYMSPSFRQIQPVRSASLWRALLGNGMPINVVVGDYYIYGELDNRSVEVQRLVRDFDINSRSDLDQYLMNNPELSDRYMDVGLQYLPVSVAYALRNVMPLLEEERAQVKVVLASELTPDMLKSSNIVYIGLLSGMGALREFAFAPSRFRIGDSYDEIIDRRTKQRYVSQAGATTEMGGPSSYRDYGYFSTFSGPNGNRIMIIAGTRDVAVMHTAEALSSESGIDALLKQVDGAANFEALYSVQAIDRMNLDGQLLVADKIDPGRIWSGPALKVLSSDAVPGETEPASKQVGK